MKTTQHFEIAVIGSGLAGIATAYYLCKKYKKTSIVLIDPRPALSFTTAQSGNNYRNWWPHKTMADFANHSIQLLRDISVQSQNTIQLNQRGYLLATRKNSIDKLLNTLKHSEIRNHSNSFSSTYEKSLLKNWQENLSGVDVINNKLAINTFYPSLSKDIENLIHIRQAGDLDGQALGHYMLKHVKNMDGKIFKGKVTAIQKAANYCLIIDSSEEPRELNCEILVNAAGPFVGEIAKMLGRDIEVENRYQQKILFPDIKKCIPRDLPFTIDIDEQKLNWNKQEYDLLATDPETSWLTQRIHGGVHSRPEGGENSTWVKLGWAYNHSPSQAQEDLLNDECYNTSFPEIVLRGASNLTPQLNSYIQHMPSKIIHYGGYYTMTKENWPLIGPLDKESAFIVGALSGFGTMMACAAGELCADHIFGASLPDYAKHLSFQRYANTQLIKELTTASNKGLL